MPKPPESETPTYDALSPKRRALVDAYLANGYNGTRAHETAGYGNANTNDDTRSVNASRMLAEAKMREAVRERMRERRLSADEVLDRWRDQALGTAEDYVSFYERRRKRTEQVSVTEAILRRTLALQEAEHVRDHGAFDGDELTAQGRLIRAHERELARLDFLDRTAPDAPVTVDGPEEVTYEPFLDLAKLQRAGKMHLVKSFRVLPDGSRSAELYDAQKALDSLARAMALFTDRVDVTSGGRALEWYVPPAAAEAGEE